MSDEDAKNFLDEFQSATEGIDTFGIFVHNLADALPMFVPGFGVAWGIYIALSTGIAFNALISQSGLHISALTVFLVSPFGMMELVAYSIGMSRSLILISTLVRRRNVRHEIKNSSIEIGIVVALLLVAAFVESYMVLHH
ncbi:MAG: stage II sporulation protein M [Thaumarchaeota archaeon]|nr:stage II sporulation protein M [Nitrososphaerota archaeon]